MVAPQKVGDPLVVEWSFTYKCDKYDSLIPGFAKTYITTIPFITANSKDNSEWVQIECNTTYTFRREFVSPDSRILRGAAAVELYLQKDDSSGKVAVNHGKGFSFPLSGYFDSQPQQNEFFDSATGIKIIRDLPPPDNANKINGTLKFKSDGDDSVRFRN